jgi:hypothetical protein
MRTLAILRPSAVATFFPASGRQGSIGTVGDFKGAAIGFQAIAFERRITISLLRGRGRRRFAILTIGDASSQ